MRLKYSPCGAFCEICKDFEKSRCKGYIKTKVHPWFLERFTKFKMCPIYECATERKIEKCIYCKYFPCKKFLDWY